MNRSYGFYLGWSVAICSVCVLVCSMLSGLVASMNGHVVLHGACIGGAIITGIGAVVSAIAALTFTGSHFDW